MHPLDSSLDTSVHGHQPQCRRVVRRRSSIDNGLLVAPNEIMTLMMSSNTGTSDHSANFMLVDDSNDNTKGHRRLSLNLNSVTNTTFLATKTTLSSSEKSDLDKDCHIFFDETGSNNTINNISKGSLSYHSHISRSPGPFGRNKNNNDAAKSEVLDDGNDVDVGHDQAEDSSFSGSEDSFCEASGAEPANQEYMMQDLGASCFWNDLDVNHNAEGNRNNKSKTPRASLLRCSFEEQELDVDNSHSGYHSNDDDSSHNASTLKTMLDVDGSPIVLSGHTMSTTDDELDEDYAFDNVDDNCDKSADAGVFDVDDDEDVDEMPVLQDELQQAVGDFSDESECESFCDADETERANEEYLKTDLGASCFWTSIDELDLDTVSRGQTTSDVVGIPLQLVAEENGLDTITFDDDE